MIIKCEYCQMSINDKESKCPYCGAPIPKAEYPKSTDEIPSIGAGTSDEYSSPSTGGKSGSKISSGSGTGGYKGSKIAGIFLMVLSFGGFLSNDFLPSFICLLWGVSYMPWLYKEFPQFDTPKIRRWIHIGLFVLFCITV